VAQDRALAAGLDRGEEAAVEWDVGVAHRVNPAMKAVEVTVPHAREHRLVRQPARAQIRDGDHAPLLGGEFREPIVELFPVTGSKSTIGGHGADGPSAGVTPLRVIATALPQIAYIESTKTSVARPK
jgi:hypothetical protein